MLSTLLLAVLPLAHAGIAKTSPTPVEAASTFAGSAVTNIWPPVGATFTTSDVLFPDASQVGFGGPTPSEQSRYTGYLSALLTSTRVCI